MELGPGVVRANGPMPAVIGEEFAERAEAAKTTASKQRADPQCK